MNVLPVIRFLGARVDRVTLPVALKRVQQLLSTHKPHHLVTANTLMMLELDANPAMRDILENASLVIPESTGLYWASRIQGTPLSEWIPGIDFMAQLCALAAQQGLPVFLLGSKPGVAAQAGEQLRQKHPSLQVVGARDGYFQPQDEPQLLQEIRNSGARFVFVGLNMPRQEKWIAAHLTEFGPALVMGVGGSLDVFSGNLNRAPGWMRRFGLEWLYRLYQEPWRYPRMLQLPKFLFKVIRYS